MRTKTKMVLLTAVMVAASACSACPPGLSENAANVEAIVAENEKAIANEPDAVRTAKSLRNEYAVKLAKELEGACR